MLNGIDGHGIYVLFAVFVVIAANLDIYRNFYHVFIIFLLIKQCLMCLRRNEH